MLKQYNGKKREIQSYFYHKVQNKSNIVALAGNNLDLHIIDFSLILGNTKKAYVHDINKSVINKFKYLENYQLQLICDNILNCMTEKGKLFIVYPNKEGTGYNKKYIKQE